MRSGSLRIGIVGAGIGGLTLALALRQRGFAADVYEQASETAGDRRGSCVNSKRNART